jgi:hypothetical protein
MRAKITKRIVDALIPGEIVSDAEIKGFVARCLPSKAVTYGYRYRTRGGRQRWSTVPSPQIKPGIWRNKGLVKLPAVATRPPNARTSA